MTKEVLQIICLRIKRNRLHPASTDVGRCWACRHRVYVPPEVQQYTKTPGVRLVCEVCDERSASTGIGPLRHPGGSAALDLQGSISELQSQ